MILLRKPHADLLERHRLELEGRSLTYALPGTTLRWPRPATRLGTRGEAPGNQTETPKGFRFCGAAGLLGRGDHDFRLAVEALRGWQMFPDHLALLTTPVPPLETGETVAVGLWGIGFWAVCGCRIVGTLDEIRDGIRCFGFAYGTLPSHVESGEERFLIGHDQESGAVWYEIASFSRPFGWLSRLGNPLASYLQRRFLRASVAAMQDRVG